MAIVYLAHDPRFIRDVAIKLLPHELLHQPTFRARFEREAKIVAALDIPAIVPVYDYGEEDGQPYLVMRYMAGGSLADRLQRSAISLAETARIMHTLAPALDEAHARGIIHRDLKPNNILFDNRGNPHISDFGTALITQAAVKLTDTGGAVGTPAYMSPEQIRGERTLDGRSDLYALGIITFEMLSGNHPYQTDTPIGIAVRHIIDPIPHILDTKPDLPPHCQTVITRAMAKRREDRFPTAMIFAQMLGEAAHSRISAVPYLDEYPYKKDPAKYRIQRSSILHNRLLWIAILFLLAALFVMAGRGNLPINAQATTTTAAMNNTIIITASPSPSQPPATATMAFTATATPVTAVATQTQPAVIAPSQTRPVTATATEQATPTPVELPVTITAPQSASIFAQPDASSPELAVVLTGESVMVRGRSENGRWLYVSNAAAVTGFVYAARLGWRGEIDALPIAPLPPTNTPTPFALGCNAGCPQLKLDAYPLPGGRCQAGIIYRTVYLRGQGGSGVYTYYWDGAEIAGPLQDEGYGFEVNNLNGTIISRAKVVSSDGQEAEKELFISKFSCN